MFSVRRGHPGLHCAFGGCTFIAHVESMTLSEFENTLTHASPPPDLSLILTALWYERKGDWESAHNIAQDIHTRDGSWIHGYLHRVEGDHGNASYWYHRAGKPVPQVSTADEWRRLVSAFLESEKQNP